MKKIIVLFVSMIIGSLMVFANSAELDVSYYGLGDHTMKVTGTVAGLSSSSSVSESSTAGLDMTATYYFASPSSIFDVGIAFDGGIDRFSEISVYSKNSENATTIDCDSGRNINFTVGPVFRINANKIHSFTVSPAFMYNITDFSTGGLNSHFTYTGFDVDVGYRGWFYSTPGFQMGLACGMDFILPISGKGDVQITKTNSINGKVTDGSGQKFYIGLCWNFGDRSVDNRAKFIKK